MTQSERVLAYIRSHPGCTAVEISLNCSPWISNPRARISDLRAAGHVIDCEKGRFTVREKPVQMVVGL